LGIEGLAHPDNQPILKIAKEKLTQITAFTKLTSHARSKVISGNKNTTRSPLKKGGMIEKIGKFFLENHLKRLSFTTQ
jgi:hypothetical protein